MQAAHQEAQRLYNRIGGIYDLLSERSERPAREAGLKLLAALPGERILEVGFGTGHSLVALAYAVGPQGRVFGIDISEKMTEISRDRLARERLSHRVELTCGDAIPLPYHDQSMTAVFLSFTLELFNDSEIPVLLAECRRVLQPGGRIVVVALSEAVGNGAAMRAYQWAHRRFPRLIDCRPIRVSQAVERAGFRTGSREEAAVWRLPVEIALGINP